MGGDIPTIVDAGDLSISIHTSVWEVTDTKELKEKVSDLISIHTSVWEVTAFFRGFCMNFIRKNTKTHKIHHIMLIYSASAPVFYG